MNGLPRLYGALADWWPLFSAPDEYVEEAAFYRKLLLEAGTRPAKTLLELGCGGGNNALHMKSAFDHVTLSDLAPGMLAHSRRINPECTHVEGDLRNLRLGETFDRVFIHDAISYMTTEADLRAAVETAFVHCSPGGAALFAPDHLRDNFVPGTETGGRDDGPRGIRFLEWTHPVAPNDTTVVTDYACMIREADGAVRVELDRHVGGLFSRDEWFRILRDVGFEPRAIPFDHSELEPGTYEVMVGVRASVGS